MSQQNQNERKEGKISRVQAILALNRALWGEVFPKLRAARIHWDNTKLNLHFYCDGKISENDQESIESIATEVIANFPNHQLKVEVLSLKYPNRIPEIGELVYLRKEKKGCPYEK